MNNYQSPGRHSSDHLGDTLKDIWSTVHTYRREQSEPTFDAIGETFTRLMPEHWSVRFDLLAAASYLYHTQDQQGRQLLEDTLGLLNSEMQELRIGDSPWFERNDPGWSFNTEHWFTWGPLEYKYQELTRGRVNYHYSATEQYLQSLFWTAGVVMLVEAGCSVKSFLDDILKSGSFIVNFSNSFTFASKALRCAKRNAVNPRPWLNQVLDVWKDKSFLKHAGYDNMDQVYKQRNDQAHRYISTVDDNRDTILGHEEMIKRLSQSLEGHFLNWNFQDQDIAIAQGQSETDCPWSVHTTKLIRHDHESTDLGPLILSVQYREQQQLCLPSSLTRVTKEGISWLEIETFHLLFSGEVIDGVKVQIPWEAVL